MNPITIAFPLASFGLSLALVMGPASLLRRWAPAAWGRLSPRPGRGAYPALGLFALSLAMPAFWLSEAPVLGLQAFVVALTSGWDPGDLGAFRIASCLGLAANLSFLLGLGLRRSAKTRSARFAASAALILGGTSLLPLAGEFLILLPGFALWLASFEYLRRVSLPAPDEEVEAGGGVVLSVRGGASRCAYCHADEDVLRACPTCGVELHQECWLKAERCPSLGCAVRVQRLAAA